MNKLRRRLKGSRVRGPKGPKRGAEIIGAALGSSNVDSDLIKALAEEVGSFLGGYIRAGAASGKLARIAHKMAMAMERGNENPTPEPAPDPDEMDHEFPDCICEYASRTLRQPPERGTETFYPEVTIAGEAGARTFELWVWRDDDEKGEIHLACRPKGENAE